MNVAYKKLVRELGRHKAEYIFFIVSLLIPALICFFSLDIFLELTARMKANELVDFDDTITNFMYRFRNDTNTFLVRCITNLGSVNAYLVIIPIIAALLYFRGHRWKLSIQATLVLVSTSLINIGIKNLLVRPRPIEDMRLVVAHSYSFPSGHSMSAMAFYGFLVYLTFNYMKNTSLKVTCLILEVFLIFGIGLSRIYLGVHYPSDVLAGFIAGLFWLIICIVVFNLINFYRERRRKALVSN